MRWFVVAAMEHTGLLPRLIQFAEFKLDTRAGELRNGELVLQLSQQPLQILYLLLEHPGELVAREEVRTKLWPDGTFLDFEDGINHAVRRLRDALGDSAETPRFIQTVPRRGYRFIYSIDRVEALPEPGVSQVPAALVSPEVSRASAPPLVSGAAAVQSELTSPEGNIKPGPASSGREERSTQFPGAARKPWKLFFSAAAVLLVVLVGVIQYIRWRHASMRMTETDRIVLADFINKTGDNVFDDTLKQGLSVQLEQSPFLDLLSERKVNETLKLTGRPAGDRLTPEVTQEVCQRTGSKAMLTGSIAGLGSQYVQEQAAGKEAVLKALDAAAVSLRGKLGESLNSVEKYATPVEEATTPSLEALKVYSLGLKTVYAKGDAAALPFFKRAVDLDPNFAMAYAWMSNTYRELNEVGRAAEIARKAYDLREKVSEREGFDIEAGYYLFATGELEKGAQTDELWQQTYPRDVTPHIMLGFISVTLGDWEKALGEWREALRLEPNIGGVYMAIGVSYAALNRMDEAEAVYKQAEARKLEGEFLLQGRYWLAFLKSDTAQMAQLVSTAMGKPGSEDLLLASQADTQGWYGKLKSAHELTGRAMDSAQHNDAKESAAAYQAAEALREVEAGNRQQGRAEAHAALKLAPNRDVQAIAALALARAGEPQGADKLAAELDKAFPLDTLVQRYWLPTIRAGVALDRNDPDRAIERLKVASTVELGAPTNLTIFLCPVYMRGQAYLMLHDGSAAAAEFQKFIDHRGVVINFPWGALARLELARAYALEAGVGAGLAPLQRDARAKARAAYQEFLTLWKDADPGIPILKQAKAEFAKLK